MTLAKSKGGCYIKDLALMPPLIKRRAYPSNQHFSFIELAAFLLVEFLCGQG